MAGKKGKRGFGWIRRLPSKRWQASYLGPDGARHNAPTTFRAKQDAESWLGAEQAIIAEGRWTPPKGRHVVAAANAPVTFGTFADAWLTQRDLKPRTRAHYRYLLDRHLFPTFEDELMADISPAAVRLWHSGMDPKKATVRAHAYSLLRTILGEAVMDGEIPANPCHIRGAGAAKRKTKITPATLDELAALVDAIPDRYKVLTLVAAWTGLRFGEIVELRRRDVDLTAGVIRVRRGAVRVPGTGLIVDTPKSEAGIRDVAIPPHLLPILREHLSQGITGGRDGLLFPSTRGGTLAPSSLYRVFYRAREAARRPDLRWHDLRHTANLMAAQTGAPLADLMARLGHSTPSAAMRYLHAAQGADDRIAAAMSKLAEPQPVP